MSHTVQILMTELVTHDVMRFIVQKPPGFTYQPGQGVELALSQPGMEQEARPFTPTSLAEDKVLEFTIKIYPDHGGVTARLAEAAPGDELLISEPFGTIAYRGRGTFIAGGAGITPFLAIIREIARDGGLEGHALMYANKTPEDIICEKELRHRFGPAAGFFCTREAAPRCEGVRIDKSLLAERIDDFDQRFYVCGPPAMVQSVNQALRELGADPDALVFEQ